MDLRAVIFMPAMTGAVIFGFVFILFAANYYLNILETTAAGAKEVTWVSEPILDNFWKFWYMLWLFGLWFGPAYLLGRAMTAGTDAPWLRLAVPIAFVWLCYPISQLSSLSASTIWLPLVPDVFARLAQKPMVTFGFYLLSIPVLALFGLAFQWAFLTQGEWELLFIGAPLMILSGFLYARLIGRLAFALRFTQSLFREKKKKKPKETRERETRFEDELEPAPKQTRDLPPINTVDGELTGYDVKFEDDPLPKPRKRLVAEVLEVESDDETEMPPRPVPPPLPKSARRAAPITQIEPERIGKDDDDDEPTSYGVHEPEADVPANTPQEIVKPKEEELRLISRDGAPKKPKRVWGPDLLAFLAQPGTISAGIIASGMCFVVGVMVRVARDFNPVD